MSPAAGSQFIIVEPFPGEATSSRSSCNIARFDDGSEREESPNTKRSRHKTLPRHVRRRPKHSFIKVVLANKGKAASYNVSLSPTVQHDVGDECWLSEGRRAKLIQNHLDTVVIIAALLLAVNAVFVIEGFKQLEPNHQAIANDLLRSIILTSKTNETTPLDNLRDTKAFTPAPCIVQANLYMVASLCLCLAAVCGAIAGKDATLHWAHKTRCDKRWASLGVRILLSILQYLIFAAVITFFMGLIKQTAHTHPPVKNLVVGFSIASLILYLAPGATVCLFRTLAGGRQESS